MWNSTVLQDWGIRDWSLQDPWRIQKPPLQCSWWENWNPSISKAGVPRGTSDRFRCLWLHLGMSLVQVASYRCKVISAAVWPCRSCLSGLAVPESDSFDSQALHTWHIYGFKKQKASMYNFIPLKIMEIPAQNFPCSRCKTPAVKKFVV